MIQELGTEKERLERELAAALPEFARKRALEQSRHDDLLKVLPEGTAVLDLVRFTRFEQDPQIKGKKGERRTPSYVGFVLSKGQPVRMVDLGPAQPIDDAVARWRQAIVRGQDSPAAADLRRLVWEPLARHLPTGTTTVILAPDGSLSGIPWAALPGDRPGTVLLEQYALATVPHAPFLLDRLTAPSLAGHDSAAGLLLAVGGVAYGQEPKPVDDERTRLQLLAARPAETKRGAADGWADLPGTLQELDAVSRLAASRAILRLQGAEASTARLLQELPRARWAHIATHGFFADPTVRSVLTPDPKLFAQIGTRADRRRAAQPAGPLGPGAGRGQPAPPVATATGPRRPGHPHRRGDRRAALAGPGAGRALGLRDRPGPGRRRRGGLRPPARLPPGRGAQRRRQPVEGGRPGHRRPDGDLLRPALAAEQAADRGAAGGAVELYRHPELVGELATARGTPDFDKLVQRPEPGTGSGTAAAPMHRAPCGNGRRLCSRGTDGEGTCSGRVDPRNMPYSEKATDGLHPPYAERNWRWCPDRGDRGLLGSPYAAQPLASVSSAAEPLRGVLHLRVDDPADPAAATSGSTGPARCRSRRATDSGSRRGSTARPTSISSGSDRTAWSRRSIRGSRATGRASRRGAEARSSRPAREERTRPGRSRPADRGSRRSSCWSGKTARCPARMRRRSPGCWPKQASQRHLLIKEAVWLENGREITIDRQDRSRPRRKTRKSDDPVLRIRRLLQEKVQPLGEYHQAIVFPNQGGR